MTPDQERKLTEKVEVLDGSRGRGKAKAAVRVDDLAGMLQIPARLQAAHAAGSTPTATEFDALVDDVEAIRAALFQVQVVLRQRQQ